MNKKGFTLVELLAVVAILSLILLFTLPNITNSVKNYSSKVDETTKLLIFNATSLYVGENSKYFKEVNENKYCVTLRELINKGYLKNNIEYSGKDITDKLSIQIKYNEGFEYELVDNSSCITVNNE